MPSGRLASRDYARNMKQNSQNLVIADDTQRQYADKRKAGGTSQSSGPEADNESTRTQLVPKPVQPLSPRPSRTRDASKPERKEEDRDPKKAPLVGSSFNCGDRCMALYRGGSVWVAGTVMNIRGNNTYDIRYDSGATELGIAPSSVRGNQNLI